jgi:hypothetical protein
MCALGLYCDAIFALVVIMVALVGAAVVAWQLAIPLLVLGALWWISSFMYQWLFPSEQAFQVLQPTAPPLELLQQPRVATQVNIIIV